MTTGFRLAALEWQQRKCGFIMEAGWPEDTEASKLVSTHTLCHINVSHEV